MGAWLAAHWKSLVGVGVFVALLAGAYIWTKAEGRAEEEAKAKTAEAAKTQAAEVAKSQTDEKKAKARGEAFVAAFMVDKWMSDHHTYSEWLKKETNPEKRDDILRKLDDVSAKLAEAQGVAAAFFSTEESTTFKLDAAIQKKLQPNWDGVAKSPTIPTVPSVTGVTAPAGTGTHTSSSLVDGATCCSF